MSVDYELTRSSTHEKLSGHLEDLSQGRELKPLASFAKAYLCMYLDLDKNIPPDDRVRLLADDELTESIWSGFSCVLNKPCDITPADIARIYKEGGRMDIGYILLAAIDRVIRKKGNVPELNDKLMSVLICFYYVNRNELNNLWVSDYAETHAQLFADTLIEFWQVLEESGSEKKPGFREILYKPEYNLILQAIVLPVLRVFPHLNKYFLCNLLHAAFRYSSLDELLFICQQHIGLEKNMPVANRVYWLSTAYLLSPEEHETILFDYVGRTREKALRLLDYVDALMSSGDQRLNITSDMLANLIYMIAPKFKPVRDKFGNLDDNVQKILRLFDALHSDKSIAAQQAINKLRKIRVMRLYSDYLD